MAKVLLIMAIGIARALSTYMPVGLASCLWLVWTVPYFVMASGHDLTFYAVVMNIVISALTVMAIDPGTRTVRFIPLSLESVV